MAIGSNRSGERVGPVRRGIAFGLLLLLAPIVGVMLFGGIRFFKVPSRSMEPTLYPADFIMTRSTDSFARGDIVVFRDPDFTDEYLVKRIVGVEGDLVSVSGGAVFLDDRYVSEPYRHSPIDYVMDPYRVPEGEFFLLGDNANRSIDSHNWGASDSAGNSSEKGRPRSISKEFIVGRVTNIYLPRSRARKVESYLLRAVSIE